MSVHLTHTMLTSKQNSRIKNNLRELLGIILILHIWMLRTSPEDCRKTKNQVDKIKKYNLYKTKVP